MFAGSDDARRRSDLQIAIKRSLLQRKAAAGFTLVELITVIVILGILALGTVSFISDSSRGFASTVARTELAGDARFLVERLSRELRNALPGSLRVSGGCLEFLPIVAASRYVTLPVATAAASFRSVPVEPLPLPAGVRVAVYPDAAGYALANPGPVSPPVSVSAADAANEVTVAFAAPHAFATPSPTERYYLVSDPVSYCVDAGALYRYSGYGFMATQPDAATLPASLPGRSLVAETVAATTPFAVTGATLTRNAVVALDLALTRAGDTVGVEHLVQVRNVP
jgi:MSHA biogenesis protein MshO